MNCFSSGGCIVNSFNVLIADDFELSAENIFGQTLRNHPDYQVVCVCCTASNVLSEIARTKPDVVIVDLMWGNRCIGLDLIADIRANFPTIGVVAYSADNDLLAKAQEAHERLNKVFTSRDLFDIVKRAYDAAHRKMRRDFVLSPRELAVLQLMVDGFTDQEMSEALNLSPAYIRDIVDSIVVKLGARRRQHAVALAVDYKIVKPSQ
jgi:DNA-binding NarL/FixJ family response regulator